MVEVVRRERLPDSARHVAWCDSSLVAACDDGTIWVGDQILELRHRFPAAPTAFAVDAGVVLCGALDGGLVLLSSAGAASARLPSSVSAAASVRAGFAVAHDTDLTLVDASTAGGAELRLGASTDARVGTITALDRVAGRLAVVAGTWGCAWFDGGFCTTDDHRRLPSIVAAASERRGGRIALGDLGGSIHLLRVGTADIVELSGYPDRVGLLCWTSGGRQLCAAAADEVTIWSLDVHAPQVDAMAAMHDIGDDEGVADIGPERLLGHDEPITALAASPTEQLLASGDAAGLVRIWAPGRHGGPVGSIRTEGVVLAMAWRPDGQALAVSTSLGSLVTAHVRPGALA